MDISGILSLRKENKETLIGREDNLEMKLTKPGMAGTLESSDCLVTVEPGEGGIELILESVVINQFGNQIRKVAYETLDRLGITDIKIVIVDKGALDCTIKARIEGAVFRAAGQAEHLPWGGVLR